MTDYVTDYTGRLVTCGIMGWVALALMSYLWSELLVAITDNATGGLQGNRY